MQMIKSRCPLCGKTFTEEDYRYCPVCATRLVKALEFAPVELELITVDTKTKVFDMIYPIACEYLQQKLTHSQDDGTAWYFFEDFISIILCTGDLSQRDKLWKLINSR